MRVAICILGTLVVLATGKGEGWAAPGVFTGAIVFEHDPGPGSDIYVSTTPRIATPLVSTSAQEFDPSLSRAGKVAFARAEGVTSEIYVLDSGTVRQVTKDGAVDQHPAWSYKGDRIAYSSDEGRGADIFEVRVGDPSSARAIAPAPGDDFTPAYTRDGRIAFASNRSGNFELYVFNPNGKLQRLTRDADTEMSPSWSPDGARIAFTRVDKTGNADIWMLTVATRTLTRLTTSPASDSDPSFSPDGQQIAFVSDRPNGVPAIWTMVAKPNAKAIPFSGLNEAVDQGPAWGPRAPGAKAKLQRALARATVSITCPLTGAYAGTAGADTIDGTGANDTICGRGGNDTIRGWGGNDLLSGGSEKDVVSGGDANDPIVSGGAGSLDRIYGSYGDDKLYGLDSLVDYHYGGPGYDRCQYDSVDVRSSCEGTIA